MSIIELKDGNCKNCYKCIRNCMVKSIAFKENRAAVIDDECVLCGQCILTCPQNAKYVASDVEKVKELIRQGRRVYATVAPSWSGWFGTDDFKKLSATLKKLGFEGVEETAIGAKEVTREYSALLENGQMKNIIATSCSSLVMLVERYFPSLIKMLAPVSSPMMAHARLMRELYGDIKVVFIGPCLSKKHEAADPLAGGLVNAALTFAELEAWMNERETGLEGEDAAAVGTTHQRSRIYPIAGGITRNIGKGNFHGYNAIAVDGLDRCIEILRDIEEGALTGLFLEANVCAGACIGGPVMRMGGKKLVLSQQKINYEKKDVDRNPAPTSRIEFPHPRVFGNHSVRDNLPDEETIRKILAKTGKITSEQELNCGSCGYESCREKAIAVYQGKADINMCLPFFRERAENISNTMTEHSPNAIIALDDDLFVQDINPTAEKLFGVVRADCIGTPFYPFMGDDAFDEAKESRRAVMKKVSYDDLHRIVEQTVIYIKEHGMYLAFIKDITGDEIGRENLVRLREHTVEVAQQVIDKQMRVVQEIASLLGETTAETKVALTNLKKSMSEQE